MRPETEREIRDWCAAYVQLAEISRRQLDFLKEKMPAAPDQWDEMERWAGQRAEIRGKIEMLQQRLLEKLGERKVRELFESRIASAAETARVLTFEAAGKIESAMIKAGTEIKHTRDHRKLEQAYTGLEHGRRDAFFFDEKK